MLSNERFEALYKTLGYRFNDPQLPEQALTRQSTIVSGKSIKRALYCIYQKQ